MNNFDKFASEIHKTASRSAQNQRGSMTLAQDLAHLFEIWTRDIQSLGHLFAQYWLDSYAIDLNNPDALEASLTWLKQAYALLSCEFSKDMDFSEKDWYELKEIVTSEAEDLDLDLLTNLLTIFVERGKA